MAKKYENIENIGKLIKGGSIANLHIGLFTASSKPSVQTRSGQANLFLRNTLAQSKVRSYIGFCIKSGKITLGSNAIATLKGGVYLLILDGKAAKNSLRYHILNGIFLSGITVKLNLPRLRCYVFLCQAS